jgi:hypothetical protein
MPTWQFRPMCKAQVTWLLSVKFPVRRVASNFFSFAFSSTWKSFSARFETPFRSVTWHSAVWEVLVPDGSCVSRFTAVSGPDIGPPGSLRKQSGTFPMKMSLGRRAIQALSADCHCCVHAESQTACWSFERENTRIPPDATRNFKPCNFVAFLRTFV